MLDFFRLTFLTEELLGGSGWYGVCSSWTELPLGQGTWEVEVFSFVFMRLSKNSKEIIGLLLWREKLFCVTGVLCERQRPFLLTNVWF